MQGLAPRRWMRWMVRSPPSPFLACRPSTRARCAARLGLPAMPGLAGPCAPSWVVCRALQASAAVYSCRQQVVQVAPPWFALLPWVPFQPCVLLCYFLPRRRAAAASPFFGRLPSQHQAPADSNHLTFVCRRAATTSPTQSPTGLETWPLLLKLWWWPAHALLRSASACPAAPAARLGEWFALKA